MNSTNTAYTEKWDKRVSNNDSKDCREEGRNWLVGARNNSILFPHQQKRTNTDKDQFSFLPCISKANATSLSPSNMVNAGGHFCTVPATKQISIITYTSPLCASTTWVALSYTKGMCEKTHQVIQLTSIYTKTHCTVWSTSKQYIESPLPIFSYL